MNEKKCKKVRFYVVKHANKVVCAYLITYLCHIEIQTTLILTTMTLLEQSTIEGTITILLNRAFENGMNPKDALMAIYNGVVSGETNDLMMNVKSFFEERGIN